MADIAELGLRIDSTPAKNAAAELEKLSKAAASAAVAVAEMQASATEAAAAEVKMGAAADKAAASVTKSGQAAKIANDNLAKSGKLASYEVQNLARQLNDVVVGLGSGQSPFMVLLQQGAQIQDVLGNRGLSGIVGALGQGLASLLTPTTLFFGALAVGGYAAAAVFEALKGDTISLEDALKRHAEIIRSLPQEYQDAAEAATKYIEESHKVADDRLRDDADTQAKQLVAAAQEFSGAVDEVRMALQDGVAREILQLKPEFEPFRAAIEAFRASAAAGRPDFIALRDAIIDVKDAAANDADVQAAGKTLQALAAGGIAADTALHGTKGAIEGVGSAAAAQVKMVSDLADALRTLASIKLPDLTDSEKALATYRKGLYAAQTPGDRAANEAEFIAARQRIADAEAGANTPIPRRPPNLLDYDPATGHSGAPKKAGRTAADRGGSSWQRSTADAEKQIELLQKQAETYNLNAAAQARARVETDLLAKAQEANRLAGMKSTEATAAQRAEIDKLADQAAAATQVLEDMANRQAAIDELASTARSFLSTFQSDLANGKNLWESFEDAGLQALNSIAQKLEDMAIDQLFASAFGGQPAAGGGASGFLATLVSLFAGARAAGGPVTAGKGYIVGEHGPEFIVPSQSGIVVPNHAIGGGGGNRAMTTNINLTQNISLAGANGDEAVHRISKQAAAEGAQQAIQTSVTIVRKNMGGWLAQDRAQRGGEWRLGR